MVVKIEDPYTYLVSPDFNPEVIPEEYIWDETAFQELVKATDKATADETIYTYGGPQGGSDVDYLNAADLTISDEKYNGEGQVVDTTITANAFNNAGTVTTEGTIAFSVKSFTNFGEFNLDKNGALSATSAVTNMEDGTINLNAGTTLQGSTVVNGGAITVVSDHATINGAVTNNGTIDALMKKLIVVGDIQNANADDTKLARDATVITAREFEATGNLLNYGSIGIENKPVHTVSVTGGALSNYHQLLVDVLTADSILNDRIQSEVEEKRTRGYIDAGEINAGSINNVSGTIKTHVSKEGAVGINVTGTINNGNADNVSAKIDTGLNGWVQAASINNIGTDIENSLIEAKKLTVGDITNNGGISTRIVEATGTITNNATGLFFVCYIDDPIVTQMHEAASLTAGTIINGGTFAVYSEAELPTEITVTSIENSGLFEFTGAGFTLTGDIFNKTEGQLDVAGTVTGTTATVTNSGTLNISNADDVSGALTVGAVTNAKTGTINLNAGTTLQGSTVGNAGTITVVSDHATINGAITNHGIIDATKRKLIVVGDLQNANEDDTAEARDNTVITAREFEVTGNVVNYGILGTEMQPDHQIDISGELRNYRQIEVGILTAGSIYSDGYYPEIEEKCTRGYIIAGEVNAGSIDNVSGVIQTAAPKETGVGINVTGTINNGNTDGIIAKLNAGINGWIQAATLNNLGNDIENENGLIIAGKLTVGDVTNNGGISTRIVESTGTITNNATCLFSVSYIDDPLVTGMVEAASINAGTIINGGTIAVYSEAELPTEITVTSIENNGLFEFNGAGTTLTGDVVNNASALIDIDGTVSATGTFTNSGTITIDGSLTADAISGSGTIRITVEPADPIAVTADVSGNVIDLEVALADLTARSYQFVSGTVGEGVTFQVNGTVYEEDVFIDGTNYILTTKGGTGLWLVNEVTNTPDNGWNDYLYDKKKGWNKDIDKFQSNEISSNGEIYLDEKATIDFEGMHNMFGNDGINTDTGDVAKISVAQAAKLSFTVKSTAAGTFYIYEDGVDKKGNRTQITVGKVSVKANQTATLKNICLTADGNYYAAMVAKSTKTAGVQDVYNVNVVDSVFFEDADDGWNNAPTNKAVVENPVSIQRGVSSVKLDNTDMTGSDDYLNFVGFTDSVDYAKLDLASTAYLSFDLSTNGDAKFTLWRRETNTDKIKSITSTTLKSKDGSIATGSTKGQLLEVSDKYEYFISMESKDADKGGSAYYNVEINTVETRFFDSADGGENNWLYDKKKKIYNDDANFHTNTLTGSGEQAIILDNNEIGDSSFQNFVGYQDSADYGKIVMTERGTVSFKITALADVTFEIWQKTQDKKGNPTVTSLQKKTSVKVSDYSIGSARTEAITLDEGEYYVSVTAKSTKATNKGNAFYNVTAITLFTSPASSLSMPETDVLASASVDAYLDSAADKLFGESGNGLLASL